MDGNFAMAPTKFLQLYIIRVPLGERVNILSVYALIQRKKIDSYNELFGTLVQKCENQIGYILEPKIVIVDFELAAINALTIVQSGVTEIKGCFYHLTQSTWRKVQEFGPSTTTRTSRIFGISAERWMKFHFLTMLTLA